jgi:thymidylate synthase
MAKPEEVNRFPICHNMYQLNIKHEKVSLQLYQRSADIFLGVPFNIGSYALLCHVIAKILGREAGEFVHTFGDVHFYEDHVDAINEQLAREPKDFPTLKISDELTSLDTFKPEHIELVDYNPHKTIKAELTVAGLRSKDNKPAG